MAEAGMAGVASMDGRSPASVARERRRAVLRRLEALQAAGPAARPVQADPRDSLTQRDWLNALDLVRQAAAFVGTADHRAARLEAQRGEMAAEIAGLRAGLARAEARAGEAEARRVSAEARAEAAERRLRDSEIWLKSIYDAIVEGFPVAEPMKADAA